MLTFFSENLLTKKVNRLTFWYKATMKKNEGQHIGEYQRTLRSGSKKKYNQNVRKKNQEKTIINNTNKLNSIK